MAKYHQTINQYGCPLLVGVSLGIPQTQNITTPFTALLDTGTYHTVVGQGIADLFNIKPSRTIQGLSSNGNSIDDYYDDIDVFLPNGEKFLVTIKCSRVYYDKLNPKPPFQMAIGMDILSKGIFTTKNGEYILEFP